MLSRFRVLPVSAQRGKGVLACVRKGIELFFCTVSPANTHGCQVNAPRLSCRAVTTNAFHAAGVANGGVSCEDLPGYREGPAGKMFLAYLRDHIGKKICALFRQAA